MNNDDKFINNITDKLDSCRINLNEILKNMFKQEIKIKEMKDNSNKLEESTLNIKKTITKMNNFIYYFFDNKKEKKNHQDDLTNKKNHQDDLTNKKNHQDDLTINEDLSYHNKSNIDLLLNEILPCIKENANKINLSLDRQLKEIDIMDNNINNSDNNIRKLSKKI
jgi:hypothetical protein